MSAVQTRLLDGFDDPVVSPEQWNDLLRRGETDVVFLTWQFQRAWWESCGEGQLLLIAAERDGRIVALAPFYSDEWSICFIGRDCSEWLDFIGDVRDDEVVRAILETARECARASANFELDPLPGHSRRLQQLEAAAQALGLPSWRVVDEVVPTLEIARCPEAARAATRKKSLVRHERSFRRSGELEVEHLRNGDLILPHLETFFDQHVQRWAAETPDEASEFQYPDVRDFITRLTKLAATTGWLRFTRVVWEGRPIAFHFGFSYAGRYHWWRPSFAIDLARRSPGEVLLRHLLLAAIEEGISIFDFGLGDLPFKLRFATRIDPACWWGTDKAMREGGARMEAGS